MPNSILDSTGNLIAVHPLQLLQLLLLTSNTASAIFSAISHVRPASSVCEWLLTSEEDFLLIPSPTYQQPGYPQH